MATTLYPLLPFLPFVAIAGLYIWSLVWAYQDARDRGKHPIVIMILVMLLSWPISILVWIAVRPEGKRRRFNLNDFRAQ